MQGNLESVIKVVLLLCLALAGLAIWLAPRPWIARRVRFSERVFVGTFVTAALCGAIGILAMLIWPEVMTELHLWETLLMPVFLAWVYWLVVIRARGAANLIDEKQEMDMGRAGGWAFGGTTFAVLLLSNVLQRDLIPISSLLPLYLFAAQLTFSLGAIYYYKR